MEKETKYYLGVDVGGTNVRMGIVNSQLQLTGYERVSCKELLGENAVAQLAAALQDYLHRNDPDGKVCAVSIGVPGAVDKDHNHVYSVPKVQGLQNTDLGSRMAQALNRPVYIAHDVEALLLYDVATLGLDPQRNRSIIGMYLGTGFGNCLYLNGRIYNGKHGVAGELGHIPLYGVEDICNCGAVGCVETRCCGQALAELVAREFPDCFVGDIFTKHGDDPRIIQFVKDCALVIATEVTLLDPDYVLMGGGVIAAKDFPVALLEEEVRRRARHPLPSEDTQFVYTTDAQTSGVVGGCIAAMDWFGQSV